MSVALSRLSWKAKSGCWLFNWHSLAGACATRAHTYTVCADACICECLQVSEPVYIEPSTGRQYAMKQSPYEGVEYMWNNQNFWVCMQMPEPHSDSRASAAALSLDMRNSSKWESLLYEPQLMVSHWAIAWAQQVACKMACRSESLPHERVMHGCHAPNVVAEL